MFRRKSPKSSRVKAYGKAVASAAVGALAYKKSWGSAAFTTSSGDPAASKFAKRFRKKGDRALTPGSTESKIWNKYKTARKAATRGIQGYIGYKVAKTVADLTMNDADREILRNDAKRAKKALSSAQRAALKKAQAASARVRRMRSKK